MSSRVLVVESHVPARQALGELLREEGHTVVELATGLDAFTVEAHPETCDAAVVNYSLPDLDGVSVIGGIRKRNPTCRLVLLTYEIEVDDNGHRVSFAQIRARSRKAGADACLIKPIDVQQLVTLLRRNEPKGGGGAKAV